jgi:hypothetical protein
LVETTRDNGRVLRKPSDQKFVTGDLYFQKNHSEEGRKLFLWRIDHWLLRVFEITVSE